MANLNWNKEPSRTGVENSPKKPDPVEKTRVLPGCVAIPLQTHDNQNLEYELLAAKQMYFSRDFCTFFTKYCDKKNTAYSTGELLCFGLLYASCTPNRLTDSNNIFIFRLRQKEQLDWMIKQSDVLN